jgi:hypothetical protein
VQCVARSEYPKGVDEWRCLQRLPQQHHARRYAPGVPPDSLKDPIGMRSIWHHTKRRVRGHVFVAALAFLWDRMLERKLRDAKSTLSSTSAWEALQTIRLMQFRIDGQLQSTVTPGSKHARHVLKILGLTDLATPPPPVGDETTV